jgi:hypothetical protein
MPPRSAGLGQRTVRGEQPLRRAGRCVPLHATRAWPRRPRRVLTPGMEVTTLTGCHARPPRALGGAGALQLSRAHPPGASLPAFAPRAEALLRGLLVAPAWPQAIEDVVVLLHRPPPVMALPVDGQTDFSNGRVTNDKCCMSRQSMIKLLWSRKPSSCRPRKSAYAPAEMSQQGGDHETPLAETASVAGASRRHATVGPSLVHCHDETFC